MTSDEVKILDLEHRLKALERAGDFLAHKLFYPDHRKELDSWWKVRGTQLSCHVCNMSNNIGTDLAGKPVRFDTADSMAALREYETHMASRG